ncbi:AraC family transcriptional regulator [uncultured Croceitalea sp.]|uniref:helix-turn-helix domain-containing protein n=1 Tax=uncultured Croceitalea sp. TaxID=1798908 RepID=UPI0033066A1C
MEQHRAIQLLTLLLYLLVVIFPFLLLAIALFKKNKQRHDKVLLVWLCVYACNSIIEIFKMIDVDMKAPFLGDLNKALLLLNLFFFCIYGKSILLQRLKWDNIQAVSIMPFMFWIVWCLGLHLSDQLFADKLIAYSSIEEKYPVLVICANILFIVIMAGIGLNILRKKHDLINSENKLYTLKQAENLKRILVVLALIYLLSAFWEYALAPYLTNPSLESTFSIFLLLFVLALMTLLGFLLMRQKSMFKNGGVNEKVNDAIKQLAQKIDQLMHAKKPFLNPEFSISQLAVLTGESPQKVSEAIKSNAYENFFSFVNKHRVDRAKALLQDASFAQYSIVSIGLESGFNSKATFNRVFKNETGMTPSDYISRGRS